MSRPFLSGNAISFLMRRHAVTIRELHQRMALTMRRVREVRGRGVLDRTVARHWIEAITGHDPGAHTQAYCDAIERVLQGRRTGKPRS